MALGERQPLLHPLVANEMWSTDFIFDRTAEGLLPDRLAPSRGLPRV